MYSRSRLGSAPSRPTAQPGKVAVSATVRIEDDGTVQFLDTNGQPLSDYLTTLAKRQQGAKIRDKLAEVSEQINAKVEALGKIHHFTPPPDESPTRPRRAFEKEPPAPPVVRKIGLLVRLLRKRAEVEAKNAENEQRFASELSEWKREKAVFESLEDEESKKFDQQLRTDTEFMQQLLEGTLHDIEWPRETLVSFEVQDAGKAVALDVDLPEIEDLPTRVTTVPERGYKLNVKYLKGKALQELYARHVHGIGFRIIGEVFATLPTVDEVTLSAFTQRDAPATGQREDAYIYSVQVKRGDWTRINFKKLASVDVVAAFEPFTLRRKIGRSGAFEAIVPLGAGKPKAQ